MAVAGNGANGETRRRTKVTKMGKIRLVNNGKAAGQADGGPIGGQ